MNHSSAKIGLVLERSVSDPLSHALCRAGYDVNSVQDGSTLEALLSRDNMDAWIFDARSDEVFELLLATGQLLLPADNIPAPGDYPGFSNWVDGLLKQVDAALAAVQSVGNTTGSWNDVRGVWLLAGSAGATAAIQQFLNAFDKPPPVAFLYAQHYDPDKQYQLENFTLGNPLFSLQLADSLHSLAPGRVIMIPPRCKVTLGEFGQISSTRSSWDSRYTPDINELLVILTAANLPSPGVIIFSGMGNDGAQALQVFDAAGGRIWAQSRDSAICQGMPQAAIATGLVHRTGDPTELARALENIYC